MDRILKDVTALALKAGEAVLEIYSQGGTLVTIKDDGTPLTKADEASHSIIEEGLARITPAVPVISEESAAIPYAARRPWESFWLVDPLDGTKEFIKRTGEFTVNIALINKGEPVLGVVYAPVTDAAYYAAKGLGSFKSKDAVASSIRLSAMNRGDRLRIVASKSHATTEQERFIAGLEGAEFVSMGSSLKFCVVAEGLAHLYPRFGPTMEWDTAAAQCVVEQAGGSVTGLDGRRLLYNKEGLLNPSFMVSAAGFDWRPLIADSK